MWLRSRRSLASRALSGSAFDESPKTLQLFVNVAAPLFYPSICLFRPYLSYADTIYNHVAFAGHKHEHTQWWPETARRAGACGLQQSSGMPTPHFL